MDDLERQYKLAMEAYEKTTKIESLRAELKDVCDQLKKQTDIGNKIAIAGEEITDELKQTSKELNDRYNSSMTELRQMLSSL